MLHGLLIIAVLGVLVMLTAKQASIVVWVIVYALLFRLYSDFGSPGLFLQGILWLGLFLLLIGAIRPLRRQMLTQLLFRKVGKMIPVLSKTEQEALNAGTVSWEGDLFRGAPDFKQLLGSPNVALTEEEQAFLEGPTTTLCRMIDDWDITHHRADLPQEVWNYIKDQRFLGMIIPKQYGGLGFSATAQMSVLVKLYGCSITAATTVSVPNSLGPAELLLKYGTQEQKNYYLPRLADGREIPCFALTGPDAGSDAASIPDKGIVCQQLVDGKNVLGIRLTWNKRYITLCPVATVIGLAFKLYDPENLLGLGNDIGISCALIPAETKGVIKGRRHFPLNTAFMNGPTQGTDVFVPIDYLIGGAAMAGQGWQMLMECLSVGRAISLPSSALGGAQIASLVCGAYARVRKQFHQPIGEFEGIKEPLARIAGNTYLIDAALTMAASLIDRGAKPAVAGAILKYHTTERARQVSMDAMDIHGGKGICLGPNNYLGRGYQGAPISITVEGANILSRSLIIFGQGAIRCHPYVLAEIESIKLHDISAFDKAFWGHFGYFWANLTSAFAFSITDGRFIKVPSGTTKRYFQLIYRYSNHLAFLADFSMLVLGAKLKRKESISARLGDVLSYLYLASAVLRRFHHDGEPTDDLPIVEWCCQQLLYECESAMVGVIANFPTRWSSIVLKVLLQPWGRKRVKPSDKLGNQVADILTKPSATRSRLSRLVFSEPLENCPIGRLEDTFLKTCANEALAKKIQTAAKSGKFQSTTIFEQVHEAELHGIVSKEEASALIQTELARQRVIAVDDFDHHELSRENLACVEKMMASLSE